MGYLGTEITNYFREYETNYHVTIYDNLLWENPDGFYNTWAVFRDEELIIADVRDTDVFKKEINKADIIIHLAALVGQNICEKKPNYAQHVNYDATKFLVDNLSKDQLLIYPNTNSGYGTTDGSQLCVETTTMNPISVYGKTKCDAEKVIMDRENSISYRLATLFGISGRTRLDLLVNDLTYRAYYNMPTKVFEPLYKRNFLHVNDAANAFIYALDHFDNLKNEIYNVGNDSLNCTKLELIEKIKNLCPNFDVDIDNNTRDPDQRNYIVSSDKIYKKGFMPQHTLEYGIEELKEFFRIYFPICEENRNLQIQENKMLNNDYQQNAFKD